ncbi:MAG: hypothetical protein AMJ92_01170 [candidate division Zixibacteria bacterium SM23_81]|nr:MAG: hypothetical protein AMJ92_01170 [candidate division Zixibacteria bacterium SM23_81]
MMNVLPKKLLFRKDHLSIQLCAHIGAVTCKLGDPSGSPYDGRAAWGIFCWSMPQHIGFDFKGSKITRPQRTGLGTYIEPITQTG